MWFFVIWLVISYILGVLYASGFTSMKYIKFQDWPDNEKRAAEKKAIILIIVGLASVVAIGIYGVMKEGMLFLLLLIATQAYNIFGQIRHVRKRRIQQADEDKRAAEENVENSQDAEREERGTPDKPEE